MLKSAIAIGLGLLVLATPVFGEDWSAEKVYGPHLDKLESGLKAARSYAAGAFAVKKNPGVEVVELPASLVRTELPAMLSPVLATYEKALEAIRDAAQKDPTVASALRARGLDAEDVLALGKTEDGTLRIVVEAA